MRYLWHAFLAKPDIPLLRLPWNMFAVVAAGVAGWWDPTIWAVAGAGEFMYLFTLASNPGFQQWIDTRRTAELRSDTDDARYRLLSKVGGAARQRYKKLEDKRLKLDALYRDHVSDDLMADANRESLQQLTWFFLNLLVAQRNLVIAPSSDERELQQQIAATKRELASANTEQLRASKEATLRLLRERLDNIQHRETSLAEIEADLARIETQFDFALEEATLRGRPTAISSNVELTSRLLTDLNEGMSDTTSSPRQYE
jgi:paraquat-inducible protein B